MIIFYAHDTLYIAYYSRSKTITVETWQPFSHSPEDGLWLWSSLGMYASSLRSVWDKAKRMRNTTVELIYAHPNARLS